jgi:F-box-like
VGKTNYGLVNMVKNLIMYFNWLQIFSFLGQKDLCRAGAICKQWHVASSHEDFWRSLKFENIPISLENCMDLLSM